MATTQTPGDLQLVKVGRKPATQPARREFESTAEEKGDADTDKKKKRPIWHNKLGD